MINELYYQVGNVKTYSKIEAAKLANGDFSKVHFNFMESSLLNANWSRPALTWDELLKIRCIQLREKYNHICLWFSGGWDSTTVLDTFAKHKIHLDEIAIYTRNYVDDPEPEAARIYAEEVIKHSLPNTKLTLVPISHRHNEHVYETYKEDWIFTPGSNLMFPKTHRYFIQHELDETGSHRVDSDKRVNLYAHDKPRVMLSDNKWYCFASDTSMTGYMGADVEMFFVTKDLPELHVCQTHMAIDFFESKMRQIGRIDPDISHNIQGNKITDLDYQAWNMATGRNCTDNLSARFGWLKSTTHQHPLSIESGKLFDHAKRTESTAYKIYTQGLKAVEEITGIAMPIQSSAAWLPSVLSHRYYVRNLDSSL
jgi:hypothetical protein